MLFRKLLLTVIAIVLFISCISFIGFVVIGGLILTN
jgi:hypothetical protein